MPLLPQIAGSVISTGLGLALEKHNDRRQLRQQGALQDMQITGQKEMTDYNMSKQLQMWHDTNYSAQMAEMRKAGINPALLYGMSGGGGTTTGQATGNVTGAQAPTGGGMEIGQMLQMQLLKAQKENIEADTENKRADLPNKPLTGENIKASTASLTQGINNAKAQEELTKAHTAIAGLENQYLTGSLSDRLQQQAAEAVKSIQQAQQEVARTTVDQATIDEKIKILENEAAAGVIRNALMELQKGKTASETKLNLQAWEQNIQKLMIEWRRVGIDEREIARKLREEGGNDMTDEVAQAVGAAIQAIILGRAIKGNPTHTPIQGFKR